MRITLKCIEIAIDLHFYSTTDFLRSIRQLIRSFDLMVYLVVEIYSTFNTFAAGDNFVYAQNRNCKWLKFLSKEINSEYDD